MCNGKLKRVPGNVLSVGHLRHNHTFLMYQLLYNILFVLTARLSEQWQKKLLSKIFLNYVLKVIFFIFFCCEHF